MENHTVFITGITGQDGVFLASQLLDDNKDFQIYGTSRKSNNTEFFEKVNLISQSKKTDQINLLNVNIEEENEVNNTIDKLKKVSRRTKCIKLNVSGAFHSPLMNNVKKDLNKVIEKTYFKDIEKPIYQNTNPIKNLNSKIIKENLIKQITWKKFKLVN